MLKQNTMKTNSIFNLGACIAAAMAALTGCYQTPEIDSQPEQAPKIVVDAKSEYTVASASADPVTFSISSNRPWYIDNDSEEWCSVTPGASATSSLTSDITVTFEDNTSDEPRTATLTVTAEEVEKPVLVKITQNAKSSLEVTSPSGMIDGNGGSVTFTVTSDLPWTVTSPQTWITFSPSSGEGSKEPVTVTASAGEGTSMRTATVRIETAEDFRSISIIQDGPVTLDFTETDETARTFAYAGETKTFHIDASMLWKVSCNDPSVTITPISGTTSGDITVTLPYSKYINDKTYTLTLESDDESIEMEPKTLAIIQKSFALPVNTPDLDGFTLTAHGGTAYVKSQDYWKHGTFIWTFSDVNLSSGYFDINNWGSGGIVLMVRFGGKTENNLVGTKGTVTLSDGKVVYWPIDTGWSSGWEQDYSYTTDIDLNALKTLKLEIKPATRSGYSQNNVVSRKLWINDVLVYEQSLEHHPDDNPAHAIPWCGGDIWQAGSDHPGLQYQFGIGGAGNGSITIDSFEYIPFE